MQIVIDIPDYDYRKIKEYYEKNDIVEATYSYIYHGTPLPKGHWIHRTQDGGGFWEEGGGFWEECSVCHTERAFPTKYCPDCGTYMYADIRTDAPIIIEADRGESEE